MPTTSETINYDSFLTLTIKNYSDKLEKNFLQWRPIVNLLFDNWSRTDTRGGRIWQGIAEYGQNPTTKFFDGADTFDQTPTQVAQPIQYQWRYLGAAVSMTKTEMLENSGPVALADLAETRMKQAVRTGVLVLGQECFGDGTNYGGKTIVGLATAVSTTPSSGSVGGLDPSTWSWWRNNATTSFGSWAANGVNGSATDGVIRQFNNCTDGMVDRPTAIVSDQTTWEYYNRTNLQPVRYILPETTADLSFRALEYQGMSWYWDRQCPAGRAYILNNNYIHFKVDPRFKFEWTAPMSYPNQLAFTRILGLRLVLVTTSRMFHAVLDGITA
jgi:hypothetical protein